MERKKFYDDRIYFCQRTNRTILVQPDCVWDGERWWFVFDGKEVERPKGKLVLPPEYVEVARFPEGTFNS
jgi:hypothetical protein